MNMRIFTVYDTASEVYAQPMFLLTAGQATRALIDEARRAAPDNALYNHPHDFILYELGEWDNATGQFNQHAAPRLIARVGDLVETK